MVELAKWVVGLLSGANEPPDLRQARREVCRELRELVLPALRAHELDSGSSETLVHEQYDRFADVIVRHASPAQVAAAQAAQRDIRRLASSRTANSGSHATEVHAAIASVEAAITQLADRGPIARALSWLGVSGGARDVLKPRRVLAVAAVALLTLLAAASWRLHRAPSRAPASDALIVYVSLPVSGPRAEQTAAIVAGVQFAIEAARYSAAGFAIRLQQRDDSSAGNVGWRPERAASNAREAAGDKHTVIYIGDLDSGASAVATPILRAAGLAQILPATSAAGLIEAGPQRSAMRIIPRDAVQANVLVAEMRRDRCQRVALVDAERLRGGHATSLARSITAAAQAQGLTIAMLRAPSLSRERDLRARTFVKTADQCVVYHGTYAGGASVRLLRRIGAALPRAHLYGTEDLIVSADFAAHVPGALARRIKVSGPYEADGYGDAGSRFAAAYRARIGSGPGLYGIFGYEAMQLALEAIKRSRTGRREDIVTALRGIRKREHSALGPYSIDTRGDSSLKSYTIYRLCCEPTSTRP